jgi:nitrogen regulatory protein PII
VERAEVQADISPRGGRAGPARGHYGLTVRRGVQEREIKAYIRKAKLGEAIHALEAIGVTDMSVLETKEVKERAPEIVRVLREAAYTGRRGDGIIYVTPVEKAVKIRTGLEEI